MLSQDGDIIGEGLLIELEDYLKAGIHIGTSSGMVSMSPFIYRVRNDGLYVLDVRATDERIRIASKFLARMEPDEIVVCSVRTYGIFPAQRFAKTVGARALTGRIIPGTFTNPQMRGKGKFYQPKVIIISDPNTDKQALKEAMRMGITVIGLLDTDNTTNYVDYVIPCNNKGRNSLATVFWLLSREILRERGELTPEEEAKFTVEEFKAPRGRRKMEDTNDY
ncbi:MAG: 30S ribosomal protein S2 [Candidatus Hodarchaeales archaeon]|jgi:small subunit ribosomal protein S2